MIQDFRFDVLKLDMSFVRKLETNPYVQKIVETIIKMCHDMEIKVIAEGVETETQLKLLQDYSCDYVQGYLYSKPLSEEELEAYMEKNL